MNPVGVVFFDGLCGLCNRFVDFLLRHDTQRRFRFAPIQGQTAASRLPQHTTTEPTTIILEENGKLLDRSTAVLRILRHLGGLWWLTMGLQVIPRPMRDFVYDWIARHRYGWFGRREHCRLPTNEERDLFLP